MMQDGQTISGMAKKSFSFVDEIVLTSPVEPLVCATV